MAGQIKGITIEFDGNTTKLQKAIKDVKNSTNDVDKSLRAVNKSLNMDPSNVTLLTQKQQLLKQRIEETKDKLKNLNDMQKQLDAQGVDKNSKEYQELQREIIKAETELKQFEKESRQLGNVKMTALGEQFKETGSKITAAGESLRGISMAAAAASAAIGALTVKSGKWADDLNTMSKQYHMNTKDLQQYSLAADLVDTSVETIAKTHTKLEKSMASAAKGSGANAEAFNKLGISVTDANGELRSGDEVWQETIKALGQVENETERDALAMQLMGKSASELNPLIEDGGETYKNLAETMEKYNLDFIDQETLDNANKFNDELDTIKAIGLVAFQSIGAELAGYLAPALAKVVGWIGKLAGWLGNLDPAILAVVAGITGLVAVLAPVLIFVGKMATGIGAIIKLVGIVGPAIAGIGTTILPIIAIIAAAIAIGVLLYKNWDTIKAKAIELWNSLKATFEGIKAAIITTWQNIKTAVEAVVNAIKTIIQTVFTVILTIITGYVNMYRTVITTVFNAIKTVVQTIFTAIQTATTTIWNGIKLAITNPIQAARNIVTNTVNAIKSVITGLQGLIGTVKNIFSSIKSAMTSPIETAKQTISNLISKVKGLFPVNIGKAFNIKLPHVSVGSKSVSVGGKSVSVPTFSIDWYAKGGVFDNPSLIGVGEAGREIVTPEKLLDQKLAASTMNTERLLMEMIRQNQIMIDELRKSKELKVDKRVAGRIVNELVVT